MPYSFYLANNILPITPARITFSIKNKNETINLINIGEVNLLKIPGLTEINFEFTAPAFKYPFVREYKEPKFFWDLLEILKVSLKPFPFAIARTMPDGRAIYPTNMLVTLEDYTVEESANNGFDVNFNVRLKQYREYNAQILNIKTNSSGDNIAEVKTPRETTKEPDSSYTVKAGDTLWNIAKKYLGDGSQYPKIAKLNNLANPNKIYVGQVLRLM